MCLTQPDLLSNPKVECVLASSRDMEFDAFYLAEITGGRELSSLGFFLISNAGLIQRLGLRTAALVRYSNYYC